MKKLLLFSLVSIGVLLAKPVAAQNRYDEFFKITSCILSSIGLTSVCLGTYDYLFPTKTETVTGTIFVKNKDGKTDQVPQTKLVTSAAAQARATQRIRTGIYLAAAGLASYLLYTIVNKL